MRPTQDWTAAERGQDCVKYYKRNVVSQKVSEMVRADYTSEAACDIFYMVYGSKLSGTELLSV